MKKASAFGAKAGTSRFAAEYAKGSLPCRIDHGTCSHRIAWDVDVEEMRARRDELLALCAEGLRETRHPHATIAPLAFADLAKLGADTPIVDNKLRDIMVGLRTAFMSACTPPLSRAPDVLDVALGALRQLVALAGPQVAPHIHVVLPQIGRHLASKPHVPAIRDTLRLLSLQGGPDVARAIGRSSAVAGLA